MIDVILVVSLCTLAALALIAQQQIYGSHLSGLGAMGKTGVWVLSGSALGLITLDLIALLMRPDPKIVVLENVATSLGKPSTALKAVADTSGYECQKQKLLGHINQRIESQRSRLSNDQSLQPQTES